MKSSVLRLGQYKRFFERLEPHFVRASQNDVKAAIDAKESLDVARARRSNQWKWSKDKEIMNHAVIPNAWFFDPKFNMGLETLSEEEKRDFAVAYAKVFTKMAC